ncbi:excisionase family DNA-binding protein [Dongia rigui]|uniref:Excisionase family DNA-binding protein n=1 Tax=Dongia rigui TaxID=940149 RepID=A0ABU5DVW2_9PROT|nr:excisionase family DNA-binding protein [Dongia rigui]MDY0871117.1 excisionase family DNA-binding protein [Dongia rigui]
MSEEDVKTPDPQDIMNGGRPFTLDGLAERWECSGSHVRKLCAAGKLRHFRIGSLYRIPVDAVLEFEVGDYGNDRLGMAAAMNSAAEVITLPDRDDPVATYVRSFRERISSQATTPHLPTAPRPDAKEN